MCTSQNVCGNLMNYNSYNKLMYAVCSQRVKIVLNFCTLVVINNSDERFSLIVVLVEVHLLYWHVGW